jgi:sugar/nucleoside kinase (ribokinase family)
MTKKITVIGSSNVDMIIKLRQLPKPGETLTGGIFTQVFGAKGSYVDDNKMKKFIPGFMVKAIDTTAAGDTYCGALAVTLSEGNPITDAIIFASAASAISVTRLGAQPSVPYRKEIDEFLQYHE